MGLSAGDWQALWLTARLAATVTALLLVLGTPLAFSFPGLVLASLVYSLPFTVQPLQAAFEGIGERPLEAAATLRASPLDAFLTVALPLARSGYLTAAVLTFAHTVGEFGVVLMIGGNIPGVTGVQPTYVQKFRFFSGSTPFSRTLTRRPIEAMRSVHVEAKEVQRGVQARCC